MQTNLKISAFALGGLVNLGGSNTDPNVDVLTNGATGGATPTGTATTNALNNGGGPTTADVVLGGGGPTGGTNGNVLLDLFGPGAGNDAAVALGTGNGTDGGVGVDLFGNGAGTGGGAGGGAGAGGGTNGDLFGPAGGSGNSGTIGNGIRVASLDSSNGRCFAPDATQIARLTSRHDYDGATLSNWVKASTISVVSTRLCDSAKMTISGDANVARLQAFVNSSPAIKSTLARQGRSANDVIGVDRKGSTLVVYVS